MSSLRLSLLAGALGLLAAAVPAQKTWWADAKNGNDANPGTYKLPFKSITKGVSALQPKDTLFILPGIYSAAATGEVLPINPGQIGGNPTPQQDIRIIGIEGAESTVLDGGGTATLFMRFYLQASGASLFGLHFTNGTTTAAGWWDIGLRIGSTAGGNADPKNIEVAGCRFSKLNRGIVVWWKDGGGHRIHHNLIHDVVNDGINLFNASGSWCWNNTVYNTPYVGVLVAGDATNTTVVNNLAVKCRDGFAVDNDPLATPPLLSLVECNDAWNNTANYTGKYGTHASFPASNLAVDPAFLDEAKLDLRLKPTSPLIEQGWTKDLSLFRTPDYVGGASLFDFDGDGQAMADVGCHEVADVSLDYTGTWQAGQTVTLVHGGPAANYVALDLFSLGVPGLAFQPVGSFLLDPLGLLPISFVGPATGNLPLPLPNDPMLSGGIVIFFQTLYVNNSLTVVKPSGLDHGIF